MDELKVSMVIEPNIENLTVSVSVEVPEVEQNEIQDKLDEECSEKATVVNTYASECGAELITQHVEEGRFDFFFGFSSQEQLNKFNENVVAVVDEDGLEQTKGRTK